LDSNDAVKVYYNVRYVRGADNTNGFIEVATDYDVNTGNTEGQYKLGGKDFKIFDKVDTPVLYTDNSIIKSLLDYAMLYRDDKKNAIYVKYANGESEDVSMNSNNSAQG
jgi:hypothetical protein